MTNHLQMGDLDDKCQHQQTLIREKTLVIQQLEEIQRKQINQIRQKEHSIAEFEQVCIYRWKDGDTEKRMTWVL